MPDVLTAVEPYRLEAATLDNVSPAVLAAWEALRAEKYAGSPMHDPKWLRGYFEGQTGNFLIYSLARGANICGLAMFLKRDWPLKWHLGEFPVATFSMTRLRLMGGDVAFPQEEAAYDLLFSKLAESGHGFDAVYVEEVATDSFLWQYLQNSDVIRRRYLKYQPDPPSRRPILRFEGTFEQYMGKFSSKHRKNRRREISKLREGALGEMEFLRFDTPESVDPFLSEAVELSRKTYQWAIHERGLKLTDLFRLRLEFAARHGWMRCYLLRCGGRACAFLLGYQYEGRFMMEEIGFDPELAKHSVGTVMLMLAMEDLFNHRRPDILDFGDYGRYKEMLATDSYEQAKILLFRPGLKSQFMRTGHRFCTSTSRTISSALEKSNLKAAIKKRLRGW